MAANGSGTTIPDGRIRLINTAADLDAGVISPKVASARILDTVKVCMYRRKGIPRTPVKSKKATAKVAASIRTAKRSNPHLSEQELADAFGVNSARVSEAMIGRRV
jgi:hypothetical protein